MTTLELQLEQTRDDKDADGQWARFMFSPLPAKVVRLPHTRTAEEIKAIAIAEEALSVIPLRVHRMPPVFLTLDDEALKVFCEYDYRVSEAVQKATARLRRSTRARWAPRRGGGPSSRTSTRIPPRTLVRMTSACDGGPSPSPGRRPRGAAGRRWNAYTYVSCRLRPLRAGRRHASRRFDEEARWI